MDEWYVNCTSIKLLKKKSKAIKTLGVGGVEWQRGREGVREGEPGPERLGQREGIWEKKPASRPPSKL